MRFNNADKIIRTITLCVLLFTVGIGAIMVFCEVKPFWVDEWFIIYSLKTKNAHDIFGQLAFMQQFPRVYLALLRYFTSWCKYSYVSLRLPSYLISIATIVLSYRVMKRIFDKQLFSRYLFVLILVSAFTFTEYFVEMKQYAMDILLSILALWQLLELVNIKASSPINVKRYLLLCISFLVVPFFSYTYPIAIVPVYTVVLMQTAFIVRHDSEAITKRNTIILKWLPLFLCTISVFAFYIIDARQLATDKIMYDRWSFLLVGDTNKFYAFCTGFYTLFAQTGNGLLFEILFGILGIASFIYGIVYCLRRMYKREYSFELLLKTYACVLLALTLVLYLAGKMPLGTPRLNAFTTPSIAILVIYLLNRIAAYLKGTKGMILPILLYIGVAGNVFSHYINYFGSKEYKKMMLVYTATETAINQAQAQKMPILIAPGIAYPYERAVIDAGEPGPAAWVLKTFPAYDMNKHLPVYAITDTAVAAQYLEQLPANVTTVLAGDGIYYHAIQRKDIR